jgi:predicted short-subunit dehydrogenase-like oxidoreductase (DUF2520 family)
MLYFLPLARLHLRLIASRKVLYHAASVMACNYLVSLLEVSHQMLKEAGIDEAGLDSTENSSPLESLIRQTLG